MYTSLGQWGMVAKAFIQSGNHLKISYWIHACGEALEETWGYEDIAYSRFNLIKRDKAEPCAEHMRYCKKRYSRKKGKGQIHLGVGNGHSTAQEFLCTTKKYQMQLKCVHSLN